MHMNPRKVALVGAVVFGGWHVVWSLLVLLGWAQPLLDFSMWAHMIRMSVVAGPFDATAAITVIVVASIVGYCLGYIIATAWNKVHRLK